ncbi:amidase [Micrococcus lylae]|uniref:amidase n=1 Tax=Micrococcus lylae TaxID=1273 RepID=UPI000C800FDC|nr:amidase [Micrococcus lylae]WIK81879.1 amidase [Micrococcus lylae]
MATTPDRLARLMDRSAVQLRDDLASGALTAAETVEAALTAAERNADLGAFALLDAESAREQAAAADAALRSDEDDRRQLIGMPLAYKDLLDVAGLPTRHGSALTAAAPVPTQDDPLVARLRAAGSVTLGKTTVPEFGLDSHSENPLGGAARNPFDLTRSAGGSSGGAAAAVAAGILPFAPGSDGGGSIRIPAAACGLVGLKPGRGTVPSDRAEDTVTNLTCAGPLAHTAEDAALLFDVMTSAEGLAGRTLPDVQADAASLAAGERPRPLRFGLTTASPFGPSLEIRLANSALTAMTRAATALAGLGHSVEEFTPEYGEDYHQDFRAVWTSNLLKAELPQGAAAHLGPLAADFLATASARPQEETEAAVDRLTAWARHVRGQFAAYDVVLTPVLAFAPPEIGHFTALEPEENYAEQCRFTPYTSMVNVLGLPAASVPVLRSEEGLSWSVQVIGRPGAETQLLALAAQLEAARA